MTACLFLISNSWVQYRWITTCWNTWLFSTCCNGSAGPTFVCLFLVGVRQPLWTLNNGRVHMALCQEEGELCIPGCTQWKWGCIVLPIQESFHMFSKQLNSFLILRFDVVKELTAKPRLFFALSPVWLSFTQMCWLKSFCNNIAHVHKLLNSLFYLNSSAPTSFRSLSVVVLMFLFNVQDKLQNRFYQQVYLKYKTFTDSFTPLDSKQMPLSIFNCLSWWFMKTVQMQVVYFRIQKYLLPLGMSLYWCEQMLAPSVVTLTPDVAFSMLCTQEQKICQRYDQLMDAWEKKVERMENNPRRKAKDGRTREYYERQFPEIRKQREQQERFQRLAWLVFACDRSTLGHYAAYIKICTIYTNMHFATFGSSEVQKHTKSYLLLYSLPL